MATKCRAEECESNIASKQSKLCHKHHLRLIRTGTYEKPSVDKQKKCKHEDCLQTQVTFEGYCLLHYKRWVRRGTTELPYAAKKKCLYCDNYSAARDMCNKHYQNWKRHKDPLYTDKLRSKVKKRGYFGTIKGKERHRHVMETHIGRELIRGEVVYHIDCDKTNNNIENLYLCNASKHQKCHIQLNRIAGELVKKGIIEFKDGEYFISYKTINHDR